MANPTIHQPPALDIDKVLDNERISPNGRLERRIVWNLLMHLEANDWFVRATWDGEARERTKTAKDAMELIFNLDEVSVRIAKGRERVKGEDWHGILLILGNGIDVLSDWNYTMGDPDGFNAVMEAFDAEDYA